MNTRRKQTSTNRSTRRDGARLWRRALPPCLLALAAALAGCEAPLAESRHPPLYDGGLLGTWLLEPPTTEEERAVAAEEAETARRGWLLTVSSAYSFADSHVPPELMSEDARRERRARQRGSRADIRYRVEVTPDWAQEEEQAAAETVALEGRLIEVEGTRLFTFQRAWPPPEGVLYSLEAPLQHTLRIERDGDELRVWANKVWLAWTPFQFAGDFEFVPGAAGLAARFDDIVEFYAEQPEESWGEPAVARRVAE
jgi:hypothetical protein